MELLADDVWEAEDGKTKNLGVGVDGLDWLYLSQNTNFLARGAKQ